MNISRQLVNADVIENLEVFSKVVVLFLNNVRNELQ